MMANIEQYKSYVDQIRLIELFEEMVKDAASGVEDDEEV